MAKVEYVTYETLQGLISFKSVYLLGWAFTYGMSIWVSFFGGIIALRTLPKHQFNTLQHKTFPVYFSITIALTGGLLQLWVAKHPDVLEYYDRPTIGDVLQMYTLLTVILAQGSNYFVVGPLTSRTMVKRQKLEKEEGKAYNDPDVSANMKSLNVRFAVLHGITSLSNLVAMLALGFHGLWIANYGFGGY